MIKKRRLPKIFSGWWIVLTGGILALWGNGYYFYGISALFKPISSELGFSRAVTSVARSIGRLVTGFLAPGAGWLTDRFGPKWVVLFGVFLAGLGFILMGFINSLWAFYVVWGAIIAVGCNTAMSLPMETTISNWFVKKRGMAISTRWVFSGLSGVITLPIVAWLIATQGWRTACVIGGLVMLSVGLPLVWFLVKQHRPEYYGLLPDGATVEEEAADTSHVIDKGVKYATEVQEVEFTARQATRTPAYWLLLLGDAGHNVAAMAFGLHVIPFLTDRGIDPIKAAGMVVIIASTSIPIRFISGLLADRVKKHHMRLIQGGAYLLRAAGFTVFLLNQTIPMIYVWFVIEGIGRGAWYGLMSPTRARYFGRKAFGSLYGFSLLISMPIGIAAPVYLGWVYDTTGSYITALTLIAVILGLAAVFTFLARPPKPPAEVGDIHKIV